MRWGKTFIEEIRQQEMKRTPRRGKKKKVQNYLWPGSYEWIKKTFSTTTVGLFLNKLYYEHMVLWWIQIMISVGQLLKNESYKQVLFSKKKKKTSGDPLIKTQRRLVWHQLPLPLILVLYTRPIIMNLLFALQKNGVSQISRFHSIHVHDYFIFRWIFQAGWRPPGH